MRFVKVWVDQKIFRAFRKWVDYVDDITAVGRTAERAAERTAERARSRALAYAIDDWRSAVAEGQQERRRSAASGRRADRAAERTRSRALACVVHCWNEASECVSNERERRTTAMQVR